MSLQKSFQRAGLSLIIDLFDSNEEFLSEECLINLNVNIYLLKYAGLKNTA